MTLALYVAKDQVAWNSLVEKSPFAVLHHRHEVLSFGKRVLPVVFDNGKNRLLFPFNLENTFGFRSVSVPVYDIASVLPVDHSDIAVIPEALDLVLSLLQRNGTHMMTISAPFLVGREYEAKLDAWFNVRGASVQCLYMDILNTEGKKFEEIWERKFAKHARNRTRKAEKEGVTVREVTDFKDWITDMYLSNMSSFIRQKRYPRYPHSDPDAFLVYLNKHRDLLGDGFKVYGAFLGGRLIGYSAILEFKSLILVMLMMSMTEFMSKCPSDALLTFLIQHACEHRFDWIYYSFDRASFRSDKASLHRSLRRFKFEHGFEEHPMKVYTLGLTHAGKMLQRLTAFYNHMFVSSEALPTFLTDAIQKVYEGQRYRRSRYKYVVDELRDEGA